MFTAPVASRGAHAALHLVKNQEDIVFVGNRSQFLQPFAAEMVVAPLALDRLDDNGANVDVALLDEIADLALGFLFAFNHVRLAFRFRQRKIDARTGDAWPIKFRKQIRFTRIGVGEAHRVTAAPMKRAPEMQNLRAASPRTWGHVFAAFPIHPCLQTILPRKRAALDEQITLERRQTDDALKRRYKFSVAGRVNIRICNLHFRRAQQIALYLRLVEVRMVKPYRHRSKKSVEIDKPAITDSVVQI